MKESTKKRALYIGFFLFIIIVFLGFYALLRPHFFIKKFEKTIFLSYQEEFIPLDDSICYGNYFSCKKIEGVKEGEVDTSILGETTLYYTYQSHKKTLKLEQRVVVEDKNPPVITIEAETLRVCPNGKVIPFSYEVVDDYDGDLKEKSSIKVEDGFVIIEATDSSSNKVEKKISAFVEDKEAPVITMSEASSITIVEGSTYVEPSVSAVDDCDEVTVTSTGSVDTKVPGTYTITYEAVDTSSNKAVLERSVKVKQKMTGSIIYLTFDDGPSSYTSYLLDVLKKYGVKATFFVTGSGPDDMILRAYNEGHSIALHTNTHNYSYVYSSVDNFFEDLYAVQERVKRITGYTSYLMRFPGGSSNTVSRYYDGGSHIMSTLVEEVENRGFHYFDWNVSSGDAGGASTSSEVYSNVVSTLKRGSSVVLQHDIKKFSVDAVERIIQYGLENGYQFASLDETSYGAHHGINN